MKASDNPVVGRWRIVEADLWDQDYLDLCGPASLVVRAKGDGEIAFGAMQASLDIDYGPDEIGFTWAGFDEMDHVSGSGQRRGGQGCETAWRSSTTIPKASISIRSSCSPSASFGAAGSTP